MRRELSVSTAGKDNHRRAIGRLAFGKKWRECRNILVRRAQCAGNIARPKSNGGIGVARNNRSLIGVQSKGRCVQHGQAGYGEERFHGESRAAKLSAVNGVLCKDNNADIRFY